MPRDPGLEELVQNAVGDPRGLTGKAMFGGWAFLLHGNLLCGVRRGSLMLRVGAENEIWALEILGVTSVMMRGRRMRGYVRAALEAYGNDSVRERLLQAAVTFVETLPKKAAPGSTGKSAPKKPNFADADPPVLGFVKRVIHRMRPA